MSIDKHQPQPVDRADAQAAQQAFIVSEVSKTWRDGAGIPSSPTGDTPIAVLFEQIVNVNAARGYVPVSFQLVQTLIPEDVRYVRDAEVQVVRSYDLQETIVCIFRRV